MIKKDTSSILSIAFLAALIIWGAYVTLIYLGVPVHGSALLTDAQMTTINPQSCDPGATLCYLQRGIQALFPTLLHTVGRMSPFLGYALICAVIFVAWMFWRGEREGSVVHFRWRPWMVIALGIGSVWLLSTTLSFSNIDDRSPRFYAEPTAGTYPSVSAQALSTLQEDFAALKGMGCLADTGKQFDNGAGAYTLREWCVQRAFVTRVLPQLLFILVLFWSFLSLGRTALQWSGWKTEQLFFEAITSVGVGACAMIVLLWAAAVVGAYTAMAGWSILLLPLLLCYPSTRYWWLKLWKHEWEEHLHWYDIQLLLRWLLLSYLALNALQVIRPFPIGWDDLGSYLNRPRLLVSYGMFIHSMSPFEWSYLTSLGFLLFGYNAPFGSTASMMVNWSAGLLAVLGVWSLARSFLGNKRGAVSALLYYALPLVGHFSFADMKIDNAVFFFGTLATLLTFDGLFLETENTKRQMRALILAGIFGGFAFATKSTAVMVILPLLGVLAGAMLHWSAFVGFFLLAFTLFISKNVLSLNEMFARVGESFSGMLVAAIPTVIAILGVSFIVYSAYRNRKKFMHASSAMGAILLGLVLSTAPWVEHNNIRQGNIIPRFELSAPNTISKGVEIFNLPPELALNRDDPTCKPSGAKEELDRYWGYSTGWSHYLTLPWRSVMNIDAAGYYVTTIPALLLFPLLLLLPAFWDKERRWLRWLSAYTLFILVEWMFLANGIPWYGIGVFLGLVVALESLASLAPRKSTTLVAGVFLALSLITAFGHRMWQFEQQRNILDYSMGKISANALREITIPYYDDIAATAVERHNSMPDRPYLYRIGTFIAYFVPKNLEVIGITDHQLDSFNCLYQERDPALTTKRLKALGFNSIVFDTNTSTIERDPNGSLHQKVNAFVQYANSPESGLKVILSDSNAGIGFILIP
jgi:hypothetical protein